LQPGAAYVTALFDELEVVYPEVANDLDGKAETGHAGADYEDFSVEGHGVLAGRRACLRGCSPVEDKDGD
jgi:hypothetical protein